MKTPLYFAPCAVACSEFTDINGKTFKRDVAFSPVRINGNEEEEIKISYGCNLWKSCYNLECQFSSSRNKEEFNSPKIKGIPKL